jgi:M6 family metalloprotease-like protein
MKKILISAASMLLVAASAWGVPAKKITRTVTQSDGTTVLINLVGDEDFHTFTTTDGLPVTKAENGDFFYALPTGTSAVLAHNKENRTAAELSFLSQNESLVSVKALRETVNSARRSPSASRIAMKSSEVPTKGSPRIPVLLLAYKDYPFRDGDNANQTFKEFFDNGNESARQYFVDQSNGKYTPQFDVYGPYTLSKNRVNYGGNSGGYDKGVGTMVGEGCLGLDSQIDFSKYDNDGDGVCDVVVVIYAGDGEASSAEENAEDAVWPCQWELSSSDYRKSLTLDGVKVDKFGVFNELYGRDLTQIDGIGCFCHEFSHCLGLPDLYDTSDNATYIGMSVWSIMDYGEYNNDGYTPVGYNSYEKSFMGWVTPVTPVANTHYTLPVWNSKTDENDVALKLVGNSANEYYLIENRAKKGWDRYMYGEGLMITHVTYNESRWNSNTVNNYSTQGVTIAPADNDFTEGYYVGNTYYMNEAALAGDLWPYDSNDAFTDSSKPAATLNSGSPKYLGKPVTEMTRNDDGTISLWYIKAALPALDTPTFSSITTTDKSLTAAWNASSVDATYTLEVRPHKTASNSQLIETVFDSEKHGWTASGYTSLEDDGIRLGSSKNTGTIKSTGFTPSESTVTIAFNAYYYNSDNSSVAVSMLDANGNSLGSTTVSLTASAKDYIVTLKANADKVNYLQFACTASKKRVIICSVTVYDGDVASSLQTARRANETVNNNVRTITGIEGTSYTVEGLEEGAEYDVRIKAVPVDASNYNSSAWSDYTTVTISNDSSNLDAVVADTTEAVSYYNLQGMRINPSNLTPGIYIRRQGATSTKVRIK